MSRWLRASQAVTGVTAVLLCAPAGAAYASSVPVSVRTAPEVPAVKAVTYRGVHLEVPSLWPVVDLGAHPRTCVRLDRSAVYLGTPGPQQDCPAHAVGRADTIWLRPTGAMRLPATGWRSSSLGHLSARLRVDPSSHTKQAVIGPRDVEVQAFWGASSDTVDQVLSTAATASTASSTPAAPSSAAPPPTSTSPDAKALSSAGAAGASTFTGMGFDTCAAPSSGTMRSWLASPYRTAGIYIGGSMRACPDGNLSAGWVGQMKAWGWGLLPIYVGPQAPCVGQGGLMTISPSQASAQGKANADDAVSRAEYFGLGAGTPIYYDMEEYNSSVSGCTRTVLDFVAAWDQELHALGYASGVYGGPGSLMTDMSRAISYGGFFPPDDVWLAHWNGLQTTSDSRAFPAFSDRYWSRHQRLHQYSSLTQSWGGASVNIDANWLDGLVAGVGAPVDYGRNVVGPGSRGFVFTGNMDYWRPNAPQGQRGLAYWTGSSGQVESNGATWSPVLPPGMYAVRASIPATNATAQAHYTVTDARRSTRRVVNQAAVRGYTDLGTYLSRPGSPISVHVGDDDASSTNTRIGVDAMAFRLLATVPAAPGSVSATPGNSRATVRWAAAAGNGSAVTGYTVTVIPGGAAVRVPGTATSAAVPGLSNGTRYTFTVTAANAVGTGASSRPSNGVTPSTLGHYTAVTPVRVLDTRSGAPANPVHTALAPGAGLTVSVAGVTGSPVPAGVSAAALNLTVTGPQTAGFISVADGSSNGTSTANFSPGQTVANLVISRVSSSGTVTVVNHSGGLVQMVADVEGFYTPAGVGNYHAVSPVRVLDTRSGTSANGVRTALAAGKSMTVSVAGVTGSPVPARANAAALNLTVSGAHTAGFLSVADGSSNGTSTANFSRGRTVANLVISRVSSSGTVTVDNHSGGSVQVVADVEGYASSEDSGAGWMPVSLVRVLDTRSGAPANPVRTALGAGASLVVAVAGATGSPVPAEATAAALNLAVTGAQTAGFLSVADGASNGTSTANFSRGQTVANLVITKIAPNGTVTVVNHSGGSVQVVADVEGYAR